MKRKSKIIAISLATLVLTVIGIAYFLLRPPSLEDTIRNLMHLSNQQGFLTYKDIDKSLAQSTSNPEEIENVISILTKLKAKILDEHGNYLGEYVDYEKGIFFDGSIVEKTERSPMALSPLFPNLNFEFPIAFVQEPVSGEWYVVEQVGKIYKILGSGENAVKQEWINIQGKVFDPKKNWEHGLLGFALSPQCHQNGKAYIYYTMPDDEAGGKARAILSEIEVFSKQQPLESPQERILFSIKRGGRFHHGGTMRFGPDGLLYLSLGDGSDETGLAAQDKKNYNGSLLTFDLTQEKPVPEVFAYGFRNPWSWSFDRLTGEIYLADVGSQSWEEINLVKKGGNYGWPIFEGSFCIQKEAFSRDKDLEFPIVAHNHLDEEKILSITGGYVYRGKKIPEFKGLYFYAGFMQGVIYALQITEEKQLTRILETGKTISAFAEDRDGEIYIINYQGKIFSLDKAKE